MLCLLRESNLICSKMLKGDWALKRKRRKLPPNVISLIDEKSAISDSSKDSFAKRSRRGFLSSDQLTSKKTGHDGVSMT